MLDQTNSTNQPFSTDGIVVSGIQPIRRADAMEATLDDASAIIQEANKEPTGKPVCQAFSLIIPVYNEEDAIDQTIQELKKTFADLNTPFEILVVNDGSSDGTAEKLEKWKNDVSIIHHESNTGYGASLKTGIRHAQYDWIVITDADGSYPNHRIPELVQMANRFDMVVGARTGANVTYSKIRSIPKWFLIRFAKWLSGRDIPDLNSGLRVFRKNIAMRFIKLYPNGFSFTTTITMAMLTNRYRVHYEPVDYHARIGNSKIQPIRDTLRFTQLILRMGMYFAPLRVILPVAGLFFAGFMGSLCQDIFVRKDLTEATLILLVSGTQLGVFALLADMIDKRSA
ncbi:MAG: glycosyltransferase family 2 protein [Mariniblastus sp.]